MDGMLSQDEINALLAGMDNGGGDDNSSAAVPDNSDEFLNLFYNVVLCNMYHILE